MLRRSCVLHCIVRQLSCLQCKALRRCGRAELLVRLVLCSRAHIIYVHARACVLRAWVQSGDRFVSARSAQHATCNGSTQPRNQPPRNMQHATCNVQPTRARRCHAHATTRARTMGLIAHLSARAPAVRLERGAVVAAGADPRRVLRRVQRWQQTQNNRAQRVGVLVSTSHASGRRSLPHAQHARSG